MKVRELIERLQKMNPEAVVFHGDGDSWGEGFSSVSVTEENPHQEGKGNRVVIRDVEIPKLEIPKLERRRR